ncbi:LacI family DNA-binding transcriptional regulator, partial [Micromonospora aurantiaca (nom. illeg.)]
MGTPTTRPATLDDVARDAGVSRATASRVLGVRRGEPVAA